MRKAAALSLFLLVLPAAGVARDVVVRTPLGERVDQLMTGFAKEGYSGAVLVARGGDVLVRKGYGLADRERGIPNTPATLFHVASVGKIFTAAAVLKLEMQGKLSTSDPISRYLGTFPPEKSGATIHHLLTHTAGLAVDSSAPGSTTKLDYSSRKAFVQSMKDAPIESKPGEKYRYTNAGYTLLAAIVEEASGQPFDQYLEKNVLRPAGLTSTGFPWDRKLAKAPLAVGYEGSKLEELRPYPRATDVWGNRGPGNLVTTVGDLYQWTRALRGNKVLSAQAREKMFTAYANKDEGYGWHVVRTPRNTTMVRRGGGRPDFESEVRWDLDEDTVLIFTANNDLNFRRRVAPALEQVLWPDQTPKRSGFHSRPRSPGGAMYPRRADDATTAGLAR